ncbi:MAG: hypothetical protein IJH34_04985 [Romboutsia sp.]|nr:hypothetical protein [Bacilli bacterium]MBQ3421015.1 hypothetical protein [Romboutsia sp.]
MLYCYDCGSSNIIDGQSCIKCNSRKVFDDEDENLEDKILEILAEYILED